MTGSGNAAAGPTKPWVYRDEDFQHGMLCQTCREPFQDGDEIHAGLLSMFDDGTPVLGDACCPRCFDAKCKDLA